MLDDCHYYPSFLMNIISVDLLTKLGFKFTIKNDFCDIIMNDIAIIRGQLKHDMYIISRFVGVMCTSSKHSKSVNISESYLWHCRLDNVNKSSIDSLIKERIFEIDNCESLPTCESCLFGKMTKSSFKKKDERANDVLGPIHTDVCGPMNISARGGYYYFIIFTDDLSRYGYVFLMKHKLESFEIFKRFNTEVQK